MGQLTNQFVSQSYQGLLNLANANTGFTANLQTITDGLGGSSPLQMSQTQVNISGTFTVNGSPVAADTGSLVTTSSFNAYTSSVDLRFDGIELETGSLQNQINQKLDTGSFNAYTSSNDSKVNSLIANTGSYATTSSLTALSQSIASTDLAQNNRLTAIESITGSLATTGSLNSYTLTSSFNAYTSSNDTKVNDLISKTGSYATTSSLNSLSQSIATTDLGQDNRLGSLESKTGSYATTGSNIFNGNQTITGSVNITGNISATSASFTYVNTIYETASVIYSSGSNQFGDAVDDTQTLNGDVNIPLGNLRVDNISNWTTGGDLIVGTQGGGDLILNGFGPSIKLLATGSNQIVSIEGNTEVTGTLKVTNGITNSGSFESIGNSFASFDYNFLNGQIQLNATGSSGKIVLKSENVSISSSVATTVTGSLNAPSITGSLFGTASNAISSSHAINADTASFFNGTIASASYAVNADTASIAYDLVVNGKCDNPGGLTRGTIVRITGANGDNPLFNSASWTDDLNSANTLGMLSENVAYNGFANVVVQGKVIGINTNGMTAGDLLFLSSSGQYTTSSVPAPYHEVRLGQVLRANTNNGSAYVTIDNGYELTELHDVNITSPVNGDLLVYRSGSYGQWVNETGGELGLATTGSNNFVGNQIITGSVDIRSGSLDLFSNNTTVNTDLYLTNSLGGQSNIIKGWSDNPAAGGAGAVQANYTGSLRITGSNNIVSMPQIRATNVGGGVDQQGYISGSDNTLTSNGGGIYLNTGSLLFPKTTNNYIGASSNILMNFTTSSIAGGHPIFNNNTLYAGQINVNSNSGSINVIGNLINGGNITSNQNFVTNNRAGISANYINQSTTLNHISSSINYNNNLVNSPITVNNHLSSSALVAGNTVTVTNNAVFGGSSNTGLGVWVSGSQSSQVSRNISDNLIGGKNIIISSSFVSSSNSNLYASLIYGQALAVSASHVGTAGGSAFLGRYNDATSLHLAQDIVFAVGTGTSNANRRTGLYVTSGSLVGVSGSMDIKGVTNALVVTGSQTIQHSVAGQPALTVRGFDIGQPALAVSGTLNVSSSADHSIVGTNINVTGNTYMSSSFTPLTVDGTINSRRLHFSGNPFNANPSSNLGAIRMAADNQTFQYTNYDTAQITTQSFIDQYVNTGSLTTQTKFGATYGGTTARVDVINNNGTRRVDILSDSISVTGSMNISSVMNMRPLDPLPAGNIGDLAVSSSNQLYFYNGAWTLVV